MRWYHVASLVVLGALASCSPTHEWRGTTYRDPQSAPDVDLSRTNGTAFELDDHHGSVVLLYFGYTNCPDVCPATLADLAWVKDQLGPEGGRITVAFISVDPERDTPEAVRQYLGIFDQDFIGLYGSSAQLARVKEAYGVYSEKDPVEENGSYTVTHTSRVFLIDRAGRLRASYSFGTPREDLLADVEFALES